MQVLKTRSPFLHFLFQSDNTIYILKKKNNNNNGHLNLSLKISSHVCNPHIPHPFRIYIINFTIQLILACYRTTPATVGP